MKKVSIQGFEDHLYERYRVDLPEMLDDDIADSFNNYLSNLEADDIANEARFYCTSMGEFSAEVALELASSFMVTNYGK